ncbi:Tripartite ATP-independent periplasmic transporter DctQ component [Arcobacter nitrofigilis DSM 7299]|uniref:Tripartite ATP-independent periplasmic transporter DctQ component n=1 Tax=Arcobacter nitrofigilis (strain ATCC 33309 / DSM 7299 / CCUG 15893 / LMG 7604 / NCTC 12251 / CI) TaxID=572480 RepID=D5V4N7_ARCNC|nr:TRAP transporter small permease [Arcobacter nitrofigilis]ADG92942.1 Tripartite ATP-independent periplasmic transporter DctQ component [Arcobacter nitrofigilis DSM 7299]
MKIFYSFINKLSLWGAYLSSLLLISLVLLILTEVFIRYFFDMSTMIADEYSGYLYLAAIFLGLAYTFNEDAHIRINILTSKMSKKSNRFIDVFAGLITIFILIFALYRTILFTYDSYDMQMVSEGVSETPLYLTQLVMPIGISLFILAVLAFVLKGLRNDI